jgi:hypothetical protein
MPFAYYARLTRPQQAVYRRSDEITHIVLPRPSELHPFVASLERALASEERPATQAAAARLLRGLTDALTIPPVRLDVLAARPHAHWGELHGLYTAERGRVPKIQLWMRTARQKRVVAFRTFLRTLLHEVAHHIDYTLLRLPDSYHTEGFYKRESSLFYQLVPRKDLAMPTMEEYAAQPIAARLSRLERTPDELEATIKGQTDAVLKRRPDAKNWAAKEVVCHLRDTEELFKERFDMILAMADPKLLGLDPDRWAEERQYLRNDAKLAASAFRGRRRDTLALLHKLVPLGGLQRGGIHVTRGRLTIDNFVSVMAWHDDNHLDQLRRALEGRA